MTDLTTYICIYSIFSCMKTTFFPAFSRQRSFFFHRTSQFQVMRRLRILFRDIFISFFFVAVCLRREDIVEYSSKTSPRFVCPVCLSFFAPRFGRSSMFFVFVRRSFIFDLSISLATFLY